MGKAKSRTLPILPLPKGVVLFPGITLRIPVAGRSDVLSLLKSIYARSKTPKPDAADVPVGCVPLNSPLLSSDGQQLIEANQPSGQEQDEAIDHTHEEATSTSLFGYGTVARITGVRGRREDLTLVVEGLRRFKIDKVTQERPYFEATVIYPDEE
ncbi:MAG: hypothetical protein Q9193_005713, partial [Seirophora villosa]